MNINITLLGQMITFALFVWFTMKYVWPPIIKALAERQVKIAEGLEAAERSVRDLEVAGRKAEDMLAKARLDASGIMDNANKRAQQNMDEAKLQARQEGQRIVELAGTEIEQQKQTLKDELRSHVAELAMLGAQKILQNSIDEKANSQLIEQFIDEI